MNANLLAKTTIKWLKKISPHKRLIYSANLFWLSILGAILSVLFITNNWFERVLMLISWLAITITCVDIIVSSDIREEQEEK